MYRGKLENKNGYILGDDVDVRWPLLCPAGGAGGRPARVHLSLLSASVRRRGPGHGEGACPSLGRARSCRRVSETDDPTHVTFFAWWLEQ